MEKKGRSLNSIRVSHEKHTSGCATEKMAVPETVCISMAQHIGAPCKPLVAKGDHVKVGQKIGDTEAFVSAPIHSSVSGTVKEISSMRSMAGGEDQVIIIETDGKQEVSEDIAPPVIESQKDFVAALRASGLVGLGGAAFPTHIKFNPKNLDEVDTLIVNGAECEPFITSDHRLMLEDTEFIIKGIEATVKYLDIKNVYIGVEENKPDAISRLREVIEKKGLSGTIEVKTLKARYPQGAERVMVHEITGKTLNAGVLPAELGVLLSNITSIAFIGQYLETGRPLTTKRITVDGNAIAEPKNIIVPIGARIADVAAACGGYKAEPRKILMGGPMMGRAVYSDEFPIVKNNNAILIFDGPQALIPEETGCIKCGMCLRACPFDLMPVSMVEAYERKDVDRLKRLKVTECMECGSCSYICPARRPLSFTHKMAKGFLKEVAGK